MGYKLSKIKEIDPIVPPCKKTIYHSREEAEDIIQYIKENRGVRDLHAYRCTICGFWHLTSKAK